MPAPKMKTSLADENMQYRFMLISFTSVDYTLFTKSHKPEEIILAIPANFKKETSGEVIQEILSGLHQYAVTGLNHNRYISQLRILAQMRNLVSRIDFVMDSLLPVFDEKKDIFYVAGQFAVIENVAIQLLRQTDFSDEKIADITGTTVDIIQKVKTKHGLNQSLMILSRNAVFQVWQ